MQEEDIFQKLTNEEQELSIKKSLAIKQAFESNDVGTIMKAQKFYGELYNKGKKDERKTLIIDPMRTDTSMGFMEKTTNMSYGLLKQVSQTFAPAAVIHTRRERVAEFASVAKDKYSTGFQVRKRRGLFEDSDDNRLDSLEKKEIEYLTNFLLNCGEDKGKFLGDNLEAIFRKWVTDSYTYDQATCDIVKTRGGDIHSFFHVDAATIRLADSFDGITNTEGKQKKNGYFPAFAQIYDGQIVADLYPDELIFGVRNPQTSLLNYGYGRSELEDLTVIVTDLINAQSYNSNIFRNGSFPKGFLTIKGQNINNTKVQDFRKEWDTMIGGVRNAHGMPVFPADQVSWVDLSQKNKDMEYSEFKEFLIRIICAMYKISPEEIGFSRDGQKSSLGKGDNSNEYEYSERKGLRPLLRAIENWINRWIIYPKSDYRYEFKFVGFDIESEAEEEERLIKAVQNYMTVNEIRTLKGLKPIKGGDILLNPVFASQVMNQEVDEKNGQVVDDKEQETEIKTKKKEKNDLDKAIENPFMMDLKDYMENDLMLA